MNSFSVQNLPYMDEGEVLVSIHKLCGHDLFLTWEVEVDRPVYGGSELVSSSSERTFSGFIRSLLLT